MENQPEQKIYYVGQHKVERTEPVKEGWIKYTVLYPNFSNELEEVSSTVTVEQFDAIKSETPYEDGQVAVRQWNRCVAELLVVLKNYDIQMSDRDFIIQRLDESILHNYRNATAKLFKRRHGDFVRLSDIDEVLKSDTEVRED